jgi:hypothetical protein
MSSCRAATCAAARACSQPRFDPLLGLMPGWWDHLPDGGEARRCALADLLGRDMVRRIEDYQPPPAGGFMQAAGMPL